MSRVLSRGVVHHHDFQPDARRRSILFQTAPDIPASLLGHKMQTVGSGMCIGGFRSKDLRGQNNYTEFLEICS